MGDYELKNNKRLASIERVFLIFVLSIFLISPSFYEGGYSLKISSFPDQKIVTKISRQIEIPAGADCCIKFFSENLKLAVQETESTSQGLSEEVKSAIAKSPCWIQRELTRQFQQLDAPEEYADLILTSSKKYVDEIAFSIAYSSLGNVPPVDVIRDNVFSLYENDKWIRYADIVDYDNGSGDYYSTIRYKIIENETEKQLEYPKEIYYWYVVHPELGGENAEYVYGKFWRDYLFNHNDLGHPLLKEKLSNIEYLWDCESYYQPGNRLWKWSMENHPTAVEAISYWIGKTVPAGATGDRPNQPNVIAHEHNGWCGELQRIAVAVQRTALVPSIGACNIGEDHVWREFYERGWHENDNWWSDGGGAVDKPDAYGYGWGKNMSAIFAWEGDDSIYDVTSRYIHPEQRVTVRFVVKDSYFQPVDGARVTVVVDGPKDITWLKNKIWEKIEQIWDKLPPFFKGKILQSIYDKVKERYDEIPDVIDGLTITTWNYTDINGECTFELGKNRSYLFIIQQGDLRKPWQLSKNNAVRILRNPEDKTFNVFFPDFSHRIQSHCSKEIFEGKCLFDVSFDTKSYQLQKSVKTDDIGTCETKGKIDFFIVDAENFEKYQNGKRFTCFNYIEDEKADIGFRASRNDWYIIFRNHARRTNVVLDFSIQVRLSTNVDRVQIVSPDTSIFDNPIFNVGETIDITGVATDNILLHIDDESIEVSTENYEWFYRWNTSELMPEDYVITAECGGSQDQILIELIDAIPPEIEINNPLNGEIVEGESITISGHIWDNLGVEKVEVALDDSEFREANGTENWFIEWDINGLDLGDHTITARAADIVGKESEQRISIVLNESSHNWTPEINDFYHEPENPTNISNVLVYANVTNGSPFDIKKVVLHRDNGTTTNMYEMYRYGDNPVQSRHEEDPLYNESNNPIFGFELGQFSNGETITYWIVAYDTANNSNISSTKSFTI